MRTAIDTNVISALWSNESAAPKAAQRLGEAKSQGGLLIAPVVYAELLAYPESQSDSWRTFWSVLTPCCKQIGSCPSMQPDTIDISRN
jgi:predicted nucleic acid-binding protein